MTLHSLPLAGAAQELPRSIMVRIDLVQGRLALAGRLDRSTVHLLHDAISTLLATAHGSWVLDVTDLTGCDPAGVRAIGAACRRALRHSRRITLVGTPRFLQRDLARLRLAQHFLGGAGEATVPETPAI
jgi:anti-anti-sigma factor